MSFISDIIINISAFRITIGNKINALKTLIDGKQNTLVDGLHTKVNSNKTDIAFDVNTPVKDKANKDRLLFGNTAATDVVIKGAVANGDFKIKDSADNDLFRINGANKVPSFPQLPAPQTGDANLAIFDAGTSLWKHSLKISDLPKKTDFDNYVTRNTQETVNSKKQWTTAQTYLLQNSIRHIYNVANSVGTVSLIPTTNYFLIHLGSPLIAVMWDAEIEIYQYSSSTAYNAKRSRVLRFSVIGYNSIAGGPFLNSSVSQLAGDTDIIDSVTFFRDANNRWVLGFKQNIDWSYPKVYLKKLSLHHSQTDAHEDAVVANSKVEYTTDVSALTSVFNVPNANIVKPVDSSNVNALVPNTNNYVDTIITTNGTTAGTVYTFKRVGLSDLTLTLTAASASFSGVVTTGAQTFAGNKTATGQWTYSSTSANSIVIERTGIDTNNSMVFRNGSANLIYVGQANTDVFAIGTGASLTSTYFFSANANGLISARGTNAGYNIIGKSDADIVLAGGGTRPVSDFATVTYVDQEIQNISLIPGPAGTNGTNGTNATISGASASVTNTVGTPSVTVTAGGTASNRSFAFAFSNLKGDKGDPGTPGTVPNNGQLSYAPSSDFTGGNFTFAADQSANVTPAPLQLSVDIKTAIGIGVNANDKLNELIPVSNYYLFHEVSVDGTTVDPKTQVHTQVSTASMGTVTVNVRNHVMNGAEVVLQGNSGGVVTYNINYIDANGNSFATINIDTGSRRFFWDEKVIKYRLVP